MLFNLYNLFNILNLANAEHVLNINLDAVLFPDTESNLETVVQSETLQSNVMRSLLNYYIRRH